jgi:hypothetical protein
VALRLSLLGERVDGRSLAMAYANKDIEALRRVHTMPSLWYWVTLFNLKENQGLFEGISL